MIQEFKELRGQLEPQEPKALREPRERKGHKEWQDQSEPQDRRALWGTQELKGHKD